MIRSLYARFEELIHEVAKFGVVGILAFVITIGLTNLLNSGFKTSWVAATAIATVIATAFAFIGNRNWAFRHRKGKGLGREGMLFFFFNGIGLLIQTGAVALNQHSLGHHDKLSNNVALIFGIGVATLFRLYSYRRWVFLATPAEPPATEQLEPEISRTSDLSAARSATRSAAAATCAFTRFRHVRRFPRFRRFRRFRRVRHGNLACAATY